MKKEAIFLTQRGKEKSGQILDSFTSLKLDGVQWLLSYYPIPERKEFNVALCEQLLKLEKSFD